MMTAMCIIANGIWSLISLVAVPLAAVAFWIITR